MTATRFDYEVSHLNRLGHERVHRYSSDEPLVPGSVVLLEDGRHWLIEHVEGERATAKPARYRLVLHHPDDRREAGALRRHLPGSPRPGHAFTTVEDGQPLSWVVADERLERDDEGEPFLELVAERDFAEQDGDVPDHELEHTLARGAEEELPEEASSLLERADRMRQSVELVALEPGEPPEWDAASRFIDALVIEEIPDDLLEQCGVDPNGRSARVLAREGAGTAARGPAGSSATTSSATTTRSSSWGLSRGANFAAFEAGMTSPIRGAGTAGCAGSWTPTRSVPRGSSAYARPSWSDSRRADGERASPGSGRVDERVDRDEGGERLEPARVQHAEESRIRRGSSRPPRAPPSGARSSSRRAPGGDVEERLDVDGLQDQVVADLDDEGKRERPPAPARPPRR